MSQDLRLDPKKGSIEVTVADNVTGQPISGATVIISLGGTVIATLTSDSQGKVSRDGLTRGEYTVSASYAGRAIRSAVAAVEPNRKAAATLRLGYIIRVTVLETSTGEVLSGITVSLSKDGSDAGAGLTSSGGVLLLDVTATGHYTVTASGVGFDQVSQSSGSVSVYPATPSSEATLYLTRQRAPRLSLQMTRFIPKVLPFEVRGMSSGQPIYYGLSYTNGGTAIATGVTITETLPLGTTFLGPQGWTRTGDRTYVYSVGTVAAGERGSVQFVVGRDVAAAPGTVYTNTATIGDDGRNGRDMVQASAATDVFGLHAIYLPVLYKGWAGGW